VNSNLLKELIENELDKSSKILEYAWLNLEEGDLEGFGELKSKVDSGDFGEMTFMDHSLDMRSKPQKMEAWAQSVLMVSIRYPIELQKYTDDLSTAPKVASYSQGVDYHFSLKKILNEAVSAAQQSLNELCEIDSSIQELNDFKSRIFVDSAPIREQVLARKAGLGWTGKNTLQINKKLGSSFCLGGVLFDFQIEGEGAPALDLCGGCTLCIKACPTDALKNPWELVAKECLSYFTIETRNPIPENYWDKTENWLFGCDICQQVCPWNHKNILKSSGFPSQLNSDFIQNIEMWLATLRKGGGFKSKYKSTSLQRAGRPKLLSNLYVLAYTSKRFDLLALLEEIAHEEEGKWREHMFKVIAKMRSEIESV
jgi:epoxyqueuosine reductase